MLPESLWNGFLDLLASVALWSISIAGGITIVFAGLVLVFYVEDGLRPWREYPKLAWVAAAVFILMAVDILGAAYGGISLFVFTLPINIIGFLTLVSVVVGRLRRGMLKPLLRELWEDISKDDTTQGAR